MSSDSFYEPLSGVVVVPGTPGLHAIAGVMSMGPKGVGLSRRWGNERKRLMAMFAKISAYE